MATLDQFTMPTVAAIYRGYESRHEAEPARGHLGASQLGTECERALWLGFRWAYREQLSGQKLKLFERGRREEAWLTEDLRAAGVTVHTVGPDGGQFAFSAVGGHVGGSMDGAALGLMEAPKTWHVVEYKTHGAKSFAQLVAKGVQAAKPLHWAQVQLYMRWSGMDRAFYLALNKDNDELYSDRIKYDAQAAAALEAKGERVVKAMTPPERLGSSPEDYRCKLCPAAKACWESKLRVTCRTCIHATPELDGKARWSCVWHKRDLSLEEQAKGCPSHRLIPDLITWATPVDGDAEANWIKYELTSATAGKVTFQNGGDGFASQDLAVGNVYL
jgi:hypothetical protein